MDIDNIKQRSCWLLCSLVAGGLLILTSSNAQTTKAPSNSTCGLGKCNITVNGTERIGFKCCKTGLCLPFDKWRDQSCDCCGSQTTCSNCSDQSDEACVSGIQNACDFGKCVKTSQLSTNESVGLCKWDCIQPNANHYEQCARSRTPTVIETTRFGEFCKRLLQNTPLDCTGTDSCPCIVPLRKYCTDQAFNISCGGEVLIAGTKGVCEDLAKSQAQCNLYCDKLNAVSGSVKTKISLGGQCIQDSKSGRLGCICRCANSVPCDNEYLHKAAVTLQSG